MEFEKSSRSQKILQNLGKDGESGKIRRLITIFTEEKEFLSLMYREVYQNLLIHCGDTVDPALE